MTAQGDGLIPWLLQRLLSNGGLVMLSVECYFDESGTHGDSRFLIVAGYVFEKDAYTSLEAEWRSMLAKYNLTHFHMSECAPCKGLFAHLKTEECDVAARWAYDIIRRHMSSGYAISIELACLGVIDAYTF